MVILVDIRILTERIQKKILWCRGRIAGEYKERENSAYIHRIEAQLHRILSNNPQKNEALSIEAINKLYEELIKFDSEVIEPNLRRFKPLVEIWMNKYDKIIEFLINSETAMKSSDIKNVIAEMSSILDITEPSHPNYKHSSPKDVDMLVIRLKELFESLQKHLNDQGLKWRN